MKNYLKTAGQTAKTASIKVASKVLGATHFISYSVAELSMEAEASMKLKAYGVDKEDTKYDRVQNTIAKQEYLKNRLSHLLPSKDQPEIIIMQIENVK